MDVHYLILVNTICVFVLKLSSLVLGYLTIRMGSSLIRDGAKGEFKFSASVSRFQADLKSVSPGLLFVLLGVGIMCVSLYVRKATEITEQHINSHVGKGEGSDVLPR